MKKINLLLVTLFLLILTACGGGGSGDSPTRSVQDIAIDKIEAYAKGASTIPTLQDYIDAGVTGVSSSNLDEINAVVADLTQEEVDTKEEIQALVDQLGVSLPEDTTPPVITVEGEQHIALSVGEAYTELGATAIDDRDGSVAVTIQGSVDTSTAGTYTITYRAEDSSGNHATASRTITVTAVVSHVASVKQTGITTSFDKDGNVTTDGSIKDDGYYHSGTEPVYSITAEGKVVLDAISDLGWTMEEKQDLSSMSAAVAYCNDLELGGYSDWRLPSALELLDITDRVFYTISSYDSKSFDTNTRWWFSSTYERNGDFKLYHLFDIRNGKKTQRDGSGDIAGSVKCVRGEPLVRDTFSRDDSKEIVTATQSHLMWQDNSAVLGATYTWEEALSYCEGLSLGGYSDWRLPNHKALRSLINYPQYASYETSGIDTAFRNKGSYRDYFYSSSPSTSATPKQYKAVVNTYNGELRYYKSYTANRVRCVRGGE